MSPADRPHRAWHGLALVTFVLFTLHLYAPVWRGGPDTVVPGNAVDNSHAPYEGHWRHAIDADTTWVAWLVARNANTLLEAPSSLYDTEHCAPVEQSLTLGDPMLTQSLLAVPAAALGAGDSAAYNASLHLQKLVQAGSMYWLVLEWTLSPPAAIASGLLFAFHPVQMRDVSHPYIYDLGWCVLVLLFAQRLVARGRWRDAVMLGAAGGLQLGTSLYPVVGSLLLLLPYAVWLAIRQAKQAERRVTAAQLAVVVAIAAVFATVVYGPFLVARAGGEILGAVEQRFATWSSFGPTRELAFGLIPLALAALGLVAARRRALPGIDGDPRPALAIGALLVAMAACGPQQPALLPNLYAWLSALLPGLDAVRAPLRIAATIQVPLCILVGIGVAAALRAAATRLPGLDDGAWRYAIPGATIVASMGLLLLPAPVIGLRPPPPYVAVDVRDDPQRIAFFDRLDELGNRGPVLELPIDRKHVGLPGMARRIHLSAHHGRRTSACYGSFRPPVYYEVEALAERLDEADSYTRLSALGFTTIIAHHPRRRDDPATRALAAAAAAEAEGSPLQPLHATAQATAYAIVIAPSGSD